MKNLITAAIIAFTATATQAEDENQCHQIGMFAAQIVNLREGGVSLPAILEAYPSSNHQFRLTIAKIYARADLTQGDAYVFMAEACEARKAKQ